MNKKANIATYYTDGACSGNLGIGGWAFVEVYPINEGKKLKIDSEVGNSRDTTNNIMELTAVYMALVKAYKTNKTKVTIYCDSAYVVNAVIKGWLKNWKENGWVTKEDKPVKNKSIWEKMYKLLYEKQLNVSFVKVKGHTGDPFNEMVDKLAVNAKKELMGE